MKTNRSAKIPEPDIGEYYQLTLNNLLTAVEYCDNKHRFRGYLFALMQLYPDGLIADPDCKKLDQETRSRVLDALFFAGKEFIGQYFRTGIWKRVDLEQIRGLVLANESQIARYNIRESAKSRHMEDEFYALKRFKRAITRIREPLEKIVVVASGGFEPGCLAAYVLGVDSLVPARYSNYSGYRNDSEVKIHRPDLLEPDKKILILEDITGSGKSLKEVTSWVMQYPFESLYAAIVSGRKNPFTSSSVVYKCDPKVSSDNTNIWKYEAPGGKP